MLDRPGNSYEDLAAALRDIARVNRWLGGIKTLWRPLQCVLDRDRLRSFSLLDVGTGGGEVPRAIGSLASRRGITAHSAGLDIDPQIVRYAADQARGAFSAVRADAFRLPFADRSFDFVTSSMMFHHFAEQDAARLLAELARVARRCVIVNDLVRHRVPWAAITLLGPLAESPMFRHDAPLSILRGWTAPELFAIAQAAGLAKLARVQRMFPFRLALVVDRGPIA
jgi:2-polyprenyl-3-methyl-5-hydroxy-6-metoxy-1,4-benzoquinol methylase